MTPDYNSKKFMKNHASVLVSDLDNTLFDWVGIWYRSFKAMLTELVASTGVGEEELLSDFKQVFQSHGTSEYAFAIQELPTLRRNFPGVYLPKKFESAIIAFRNARHAALRLYPTVMETLRTLKAKRCLIVAYTESTAYYTQYRIKALGLDGLIDYLYSPPDHDLPMGTTAEMFRSRPAEHYALSQTVHRHTPEGEYKPNPKVLLDIVKEIPASPHEVVYVGDSLIKDVTMAQAAGIRDVWARYGAAQTREEYALLRRVTHWAEARVEEERRTTPAEIRAGTVLEREFAELLDKFKWRRFAKTSPLTTLENREPEIR
jgi:phosphoglycolate phosphatase